MKGDASVVSRGCAILLSAIFAFAITSVCSSESARASESVLNFRALAASNLLVLGPIEHVDSSKERVQILRQWISLPKTFATRNLESLLGHVFAVYGSIAADGSLEVDSVADQDSVDYVPGSTRLYLKGSITELDDVRGTAQIGSLSVSYSNALHTLDAADLSVGAVVSFGGLQFAGTSKLYADNALVHPTGQTGSGTVKPAGQTGSGEVKPAGQTGSGDVKAAGQTGSGC